MKKISVFCCISVHKFDGESISRMKTMYLDISVPRIVATRLLSRLWSGAYYAPTGTGSAGGNVGAGA
jgi:hypothetical protein